MLKSIYETIQTKLEEIDSIQYVVDHMLGENETVDGYPAVVFYHSDSTVDTETNQSNLRTWNFAIIPLQEFRVKGMDEAFGTLYANLLDDILDKFGEEWDLGNTDEGHRMWGRVTSISRPESTPMARGRVIASQINLEVKYIKNN